MLLGNCGRFLPHVYIRGLVQKVLKKIECNHSLPSVVLVEDPKIMFFEM